MVKIMDLRNFSKDPGGYLNNGKIMMWCRFSGAPTLGLPGMMEHYQKRIEASRYLNLKNNRGGRLMRFLDFWS